MAQHKGFVTSAAPLLAAPDLLQAPPEFLLTHGPRETTTAHGAADPPDLQCTKGKGKHAQLDVAPVQMLHHGAINIEVATLSNH